MGLITGLLTLPLAPVRGTAWIAEKVQEQAELEANDEGDVMAQLMDLEAARETGEYDDAELEALEDELVARLMQIRGFGEEDPGDGLR
jgi:hypothetical protein